MSLIEIRPVCIGLGVASVYGRVTHRLVAYKHRTDGITWIKEKVFNDLPQWEP